MEIILNEEKIKVEKSLSLLKLLEIHGYSEIKMAVAVNQVFIARTLHAETILHNNDVVDIIIPMQGG